MNDLLTAARKYIKAGISVIATDENKRSLFSWKDYQQQIISPEGIAEQLKHQKADGLAIVCGAVSGGLEVIDVDTKYCLTGDLYERLAAAIKEADKALFDSLLIIRTRSGGYHLYYRCEELEGNQKLALRKATEDELKANPQLKFMCLIETRGEAGYVCAPPTNGYVKVQGGMPPVITIDQREVLLSISRSFNEFFEAPPTTHTHEVSNKDYGLSPFDDYNKRGDVVGLLQRHGWTVVRDTADKVVFKRPGNTDSKSSGDFNRQLNWFSVFTTNSCFTPNKAYLPYAVFAMLECNGDYKQAARKLMDEGYGERRQDYGEKIEKDLFKKKQEGLTKSQLVDYLVRVHDKPVDVAEEIVQVKEDEWGEKVCTFWEINKAGNIIINRYLLERFLSDVGGFHLYFYDENSTIYRLIKMKDGFVEEASTEQVKKFIKDYVNSLPASFDGGKTPQDLLEVIYKGSDTYFSKSFIEFLDHATPDFLIDKNNGAYFPFKNGIVEVTKEGVALKTYGEVGKVIWKSDVIDFNITIDQHFEPTLCEYFRFIEQICGGDDDKRNYALTLIGYLCHKFKDPSRPYSVILAEETENESEGGGTGKGIFVKALSYLMNTERVDGKNFKIDKNFAFQRVTLSTKLVAIEDCRKNIDFEGFYSIITEGITVEKKNKDELFISYKDSPKIMFTTNYTIPSTGNHAKRRQRVFEFANTFNSTYTPEDYFGHKLFDDWDTDEWNRFYNLMFFCASLYMDVGLKEVVNSEKLKRKHVKLNFGDEFLEWWDHYTANGCADWKPFKEVFNNFMIENDFDKKDYSQKRFKKAMEISAEMFTKKVETRRNSQAENRHEIRLINE